MKYKPGFKQAIERRNWFYAVSVLYKIQNTKNYCLEQLVAHAIYLSQAIKQSVQLYECMAVKLERLQTERFIRPELAKLLTETRTQLSEADENNNQAIMERLTRLLDLIEHLYSQNKLAGIEQAMSNFYRSELLADDIHGQQLRLQQFNPYLTAIQIFRITVRIGLGEHPLPLEIELDFYFKNWLTENFKKCQEEYAQNAIKKMALLMDYLQSAELP